MLAILMIHHLKVYIFRFFFANTDYLLQLSILLHLSAAIAVLLIARPSTWKNTCQGTYSKVRSPLHPRPNLPIVIDQHGSDMDSISCSLLGLSMNILKTLVWHSVHRMTSFCGLSVMYLSAPNIKQSRLPLASPIVFDTGNPWVYFRSSIPVSVHTRTRAPRVWISTGLV